MHAKSGNKNIENAEGKKHVEICGKFQVWARCKKIDFFSHFLLLLLKSLPCDYIFFAVLKRKNVAHKKLTRKFYLKRCVDVWIVAIRSHLLWEYSSKGDTLAQKKNKKWKKERTYKWR